MFWFAFVCVYSVLIYSTVSVTGQCTVSSSAISASGSEESLQILKRNLEECEQRSLKLIFQNFSSRFDLQQTSNNDLASKVEEQIQRFEIGQQNLSYALQTVSKSLDEKFQTLNKTLSSAIDTINKNLNAIIDHVNKKAHYIESQDHCQNTSVVCDCSDIRANGYTSSGVYRIYVDHQGKRYYADAFCDMATENGRWTIFQRRKDGSEDFYREWNYYVNGFGNPNGEFWLGNEFLYLMTSKRRYRLRIDLEDFVGEKRFALYSTFNISSSTDKYRLTVGNYSGTAGGDSLRFHNGCQFSTKDNDNDESPSSCAAVYRGGWWYRNCHHSNLNGLYLRGRYSATASLPGKEGVEWAAWYGNWYSLKTTEMKISA